MAYLGNSPGVASQRIVTTFTATAGQTTFTPSSGYALGYCDVFQNGVKLVAGDDYTASNGTTVVLASGANAGDSVEVVAYIPRGLSDGYTKAEADALLAGRVSKAGDTMTGPLKVARGTQAQRDALQLHVTDSITDGNYDAITWWQGVNAGTNSAALGSLRGVYTSAGRGELEWWSRPEIEKVGGSPYFRVDQHGRVRMPFQPAFCAQAVNADTDYATGVTISYPTVLLNVGSHYNASTSRFTAPVAGTYCFSWDGWHNNSQVVRLYIMRNGNYYTGYGGAAGIHCRLGATASDEDSSKTVLMYLNAGDYVEIFNGASSSTARLFYSSAFSGYLIG